MIMPERAPTSDEQKRWDDFKRRVDRLQLAALQNTFRARNLDILTEFCTTWGLPAPTVSAAWQSDLAAMMLDIGKLKKAIYLVEAFELGVRFETNGEITIMAPASYTNEQIEAYGLGMWFVPIALGVVVIAALVARMYQLEQKEKELAACQSVLEQTEQDICADPSTPACKAWEDRKQRSGYGQNETTIESIGKSLKSWGTMAAKGAGIGFAIAIGLAAWKFLRK